MWGLLCTNTHTVGSSCCSCSTVRYDSRAFFLDCFVCVSVCIRSWLFMLLLLLRVYCERRRILQLPSSSSSTRPIDLTYGQAKTDRPAGRPTDKLTHIYTGDDDGFSQPSDSSTKKGSQNEHHIQFSLVLNFDV